MALLWTATLWSVALVTVALAVRILDPRRDVFLLAIYAQVVIYVHIAPTLAAAELDAGRLAIYVRLQWLAIVLLEIPLVVVYAVAVRRFARKDRDTTYTLDARRAWILAGISLVLATGYLWVALGGSLLYRRLGIEIAERQLELSLLEFAVYRGFQEAGIFLLAFLIAIWRLTPREAPARRLIGWTLAVTTLVFLSHSLINSRLATLVVLVTMAGMVYVTQRRGPSIRPATAVLMVLTALAGLYTMRVVENVRTAFKSGRDIFQLSTLQIGGPRAVDPSDRLEWRLNGIDLVAQIAPRISVEGPAWGTAWILPFVVSLDPIVRTTQTIELKRTGLTTAKSVLLLRYAGVALEDYYSSMLSDAYGNFGPGGFLMVGVILAILMAYATSALHDRGPPFAVLLGAFIIARGLSFEQEFGTLLYGWFKLIPLVALLAWWNPLRAVPRPDEG